MSTISSVSSTSDLANTILNSFDKDQDGSLSKTEFASFLTQLVSGLKTNSTSSESSESSESSSATAATTGMSTLFATVTSSVTSDDTREVVGSMMGFDGTKLADTTHDNLKYEVGRILQYYPNTPAGLQSALAEIQELVPGATITGTNGDKIDFGDYTEDGETIGTVDVIIGAGSGGVGWAWNPVDE
jgi:hypothetical protein